MTALLLTFALALHRAFEQLSCRLRISSQARRDRIAVARLSAYELRDIGLSHAAALSNQECCC